MDIVFSMSPLLFCVVAVCVLVIGYYIVVYKRPLAWIPGPTPYPFFGNVLQLQPTKSHVNLHDLSKKYGGVFKFFFFDQPIVVVSDFNALNTLLVSKPTDFADRPNNFRSKILTMDFAGIIMTDWNEKVKGRRKVAHSYLKQFGSGMQKLENVAMEATDEMIDRIEAHGGKAFEMRPVLARCTADMTYILLIGKTLIHDDSESANLVDLVDDWIKVSSKSMLGEFLDHFPMMSFAFKDFMSRIQQVVKLQEKIIKDWLRGDVTEGFVGYLKTMSQEKKEQFCVSEEKEQIMVTFDIFMAGAFTTASSLSMLVNVLAQMPEKQSKLREEVYQVLGREQRPTLADRPSMPYLNATILELNRFASIAAFAAPHKVTRDTELNGLYIPKGTETIMNLWSLHHQEKIWGDPYNFRPERYLDDDGNVISADHPNRKNNFTFGAGSRVCIGEIFASQRMFLIMARMIQRFEILPETTIEAQPSMHPRDAIGLGQGIAPPTYKVRLIPLAQ